jgi:hypothetical protein
MSSLGVDPIFPSRLMDWVADAIAYFDSMPVPTKPSRLDERNRIRQRLSIVLSASLNDYGVFLAMIGELLETPDRMASLANIRKGTVMEAKELLQRYRTQATARRHIQESN